jgi:putative heme degradation protein
MTDTTNPRELLKQSPAEILASLPAMGRVMLSARAGGAIHERMGVVGDIAVEAGTVRLSGEFHDSTLDLSVVTRLVADRSGKMRDRVLPKLECQDAAGEALFA